jgi:hypothetical protein
MKESLLVTPFIKQFVMLLSRDSQLLYDLRTRDLCKLYSQLISDVKHSMSLLPAIKKRKNKKRILWHLKPQHSLLVLYPITTFRSLKSLTRLRLCTTITSFRLPIVGAN